MEFFVFASSALVCLATQLGYRAEHHGGLLFLNELAGSSNTFGIERRKLGLQQLALFTGYF